MSQFFQYSYGVEYPTKSFKRFVIKAPNFIRPQELISAVNQHGEIKLHAVVDSQSEITDHEFLLVGTGAQIPAEYIDRIYRIAALNLADGKYGYHLYGLIDSSESLKSLEAAPYKFVEIIYQSKIAVGDMSNFLAIIHNFVTNNDSAVKYESITNQGIVISFCDRSAEIELSEEFIELRDYFEDCDEMIKSFRVYSALNAGEISA